MNVEVNKKEHKVEFDSLNDFYCYITKTPLNESFRWRSLASSEQSSKKTEWTKTESFEQASDLFKKGWSEVSERLTQKLKAEEKIEPSFKYKNTNSVVGFQPIVPLYLMGVPNNMASKKMVPMKQKVVTLNKSLNYSCSTSSDILQEESIKAFRIIKKLESQGYRINLNIVIGTGYGSEKYFVKIKIKNANEKLNISKLAFPLVHPSMLRRLYFRFIEVYPPVSKSFTSGYGMPQSPDTMKEVWKGDILLPQFIMKDIEKINTLDDLENL